MRFTSLDLELNQPGNEIIQIGASYFDTDIGLIGRQNIYVDPEVEVNWNYPLNTGISLQDLFPIYFRDRWSKESFLQKEAMQMFWDTHKTMQCGKKFIQWGRGDLKLLLEQSQGCGYPSHLRSLDLKQVYQYIWQPSARLEKQSSLSKACANLNVPPPFPAHDAAEDAHATGLVFLKMFTQVGALLELLSKVDP